MLHFFGTPCINCIRNIIFEWNMLRVYLLNILSNQQGAGSGGQKEQRSLQRRFKEGRRGGAGKIGNKRKGEGGSSQKKAEKANTEKKVQDLQGKIKANKEKTALAKGEKKRTILSIQGDIQGEIPKNQFLAIKSCRNILQPSS